jgi:hypothetical protein
MASKIRKSLLLKDLMILSPKYLSHLFTNTYKFPKILLGHAPRNITDSLKDIWGIRIQGTSLEPIVRNGQIVLIKKQDIKNKITNDMLACISINDIGEVIKRCFIKDSKCILCAINPIEREIPILVDLDSIQHAYVLKGVIFEVGIGRTIE